MSNEEEGGRLVGRSGFREMVRRRRFWFSFEKMRQGTVFERRNSGQWRSYRFQKGPLIKNSSWFLK